MKRLTILIPLEESSFSRQILSHIQRLFDPQTHSLILLRVAEMPVGITRPPAPAMSRNIPLPSYVTALDLERARHPIYAEQEEPTLRAALERELRAAAGPLLTAGYQVRVVVRFGEPAEEIADFANSTRVDLVAMATHARTGIRQFVLGSVAEQVLRSVEAPVLLVRPPERP